MFVNCRGCGGTCPEGCELCVACTPPPVQHCHVDDLSREQKLDEQKQKRLLANLQRCQDEAMNLLNKAKSIGCFSLNEQDEMARRSSKIFNLCEEMKNELKVKHY